MYMLIRKLGFLAGLTLCIAVTGHSQTVTSIRDGFWSDPSVWDTGQVPTLATASETVINHAVIIPTASVNAIRNVVVNNSLTVETGAIVDLMPDALPEKNDLQVLGTLVLHDGSTFNGTSVSNTSFESGARYVHLQGPLGFIPYATWDANSTFEIAGFKAQGYINIAHSDSWKQNFGHVLYNCTQQTTPFVDLNGYLRNIAGNFRVQSTNGQALRLSTTQNSPISIGGDFIVEGPSRTWLSTSPTTGVCNIQGNFLYNSTSTGISYLTTKGVMTINVQGNFAVNTSGRIHMASTSPDSTGMRQTTLALRGDLVVLSGSMVGPPLPGKGKINFLGSAVQRFSAPSLPSFQGSIDYLVETGSTLDLGTSFLSNAAGSLVVRGKLQLGSVDPQGAIQLSGNGNVRILGERIFEPGSAIEYNGQAEQWIGDGHPTSPTLNLICSNPAGVTLLNAIVTNDMTITGKFNGQQFPLTAHGHISIAPATEFVAEQINLAGGQEQSISVSGTTLKNLVINKSGNGVMLTSPLKISNSLLIESPNTLLASNGNLSLLSNSDGVTGTAGIASLPAGSSVDGDVTVERYMSAEGRIYRYISSPVRNATVASPKDDFPITATFQYPSTGSGISSGRPSFFHYNESIGGLQAGWRPYPASGLSSAAPLLVGRGYCAYIWRGGNPITWDVTGPLHQGDIELPVAFTPDSQPSNGWNLVGNPYASAVQWNESVKSQWTIANISTVIAIRDNGTGTFQYRDLDDGNAGLDEGQVASGQAFWVRATAAAPRLIIGEGVKASAGAAFFRTEVHLLPGFTVSVQKDGLSDVAYYKVKPASKPSLDDGDGLKLDNDFFDVSIISSDHHSLAIHASGRFPCDTVITLGVKDLSPGNYRLSIAATQEFTRYTYTLRDNFTGAASPLGEGDTVTISVNWDPRSFAFDRLSISIKENAPDIDREVMGESIACSGSVATVTIQNPEAYVVYSVWSGTKKLSAIRTDRAGDLDLNFNTDSLSLGPHLLTFEARSACHVATLQANHLINIYSTPQVLIVPDTACAGTPAILTAFSDQRDVTFHWFSEKDSEDTLSTGYSFETPPLSKKMIYYVVAEGKLGCSSGRFEAEALVKTFRPAKIQELGDSMLTSNYETGNQWFFNGYFIENTGSRYLQLNDPGVYTLRVDTLGCFTQDTLAFIISRPEPKQPSPVVYPNPASEFLYIKQGVGVQQVEIWDALGKLVLIEYIDANGSDIAISIHKLTRGVYTAVIFLRQEKRIFRFIKLAG